MFDHSLVFLNVFIQSAAVILHTVRNIKMNPFILPACSVSVSSVFGLHLLLHQFTSWSQQLVDRGADRTRTAQITSKSVPPLLIRVKAVCVSSLEPGPGPRRHNPSLQQAFCLKTWPSWTVPHQYVDLDLQSAAETSHTDVAL